MLNLSKLLPQLDIKASGVIHVGGHKAQEYQEYKDVGLVNQVWIEANPFFFNEILNVTKGDNNCLVLNYAVFDEEKEVRFGLANNGASSSILPLKKHLEYYPNINYDGYLQMKTKRLDKIIEDSSIDLSKHDGLVMDVQGVELRVLKSLGQLVNNFKFIQSEINLEELYEGCCLVNEIDDYLSGFGFKRAITELWDNGAVGWGDALYIKK